MSDLISRQAAIDALRASTQKYTGFMEMEMYTDDDAVEAIINLPSAQPIEAVPTKHYNTESYKMTVTDFPPVEYAPIKRGRWIYDDEAYPGGNPYGHYNCDQCGESVPHKTIYCPNCGARMFDKDTDVPDKNVGKMDEVEE